MTRGRSALQVHERGHMTDFIDEDFEGMLLGVAEFWRGPLPKSDLVDLIEAYRTKRPFKGHCVTHYNCRSHPASGDPITVIRGFPV